MLSKQEKRPTQQSRLAKLLDGPKQSDDEITAIQDANNRKRRFRENRDMTVFLVFIMVLVYFATTSLQYTLVSIIFVCAGPFVWLYSRRTHIGFLGMLAVYIVVAFLVALVSFVAYLFTFYV